jgi:hypothetical protein
LEAAARAQNAAVAAVQNSTIVEPYDSMLRGVSAYGPDTHPAFHEEVIEKLIQMAQSPSAYHRLFVVRHRLTPEAMVIMMQNDANPEVRAAVERVVAYNAAQSEVADNG